MGSSLLKAYVRIKLISRVGEREIKGEPFLFYELDFWETTPMSFLGKELMKGLRLEKMDDILHDFKNPAIAVAGFAKRVQKILQEGAYPKNEKVDQALDILLKETSRIQELALTLIIYIFVLFYYALK